MIRSSKSDMISENLSPVARNHIWREHIGKESSHSALREAFFISPTSLSTVTGKPHNEYSARLSHREYTEYSALAHQKYADARASNTGMVHTSRSQTSRATGGEIVSPRKPGDRSQETAAQDAQTDAEARETRAADTVELLHHLHGAQLPPRAKFSFPQTSSQEYGWLSEPLSRPDHSERELFQLGIGRSTADITDFADKYVRAHHQSPFIGASKRESGPRMSHGTADANTKYAKRR